MVSGAGRNAPGLRRPKPCVPGEPFPLVTCGPQGLALSRGPRRGGLERVLPAVDRGASPKSRPGISTGVHAEQATNTACGTPGNFRHLAARPPCAFHFRTWTVGTGSPRRPARPRFSSAPSARRTMPRMRLHRENEDGCLKSSSRASAKRAIFSRRPGNARSALSGTGPWSIAENGPGSRPCGPRPGRRANPPPHPENRDCARSAAAR